MKTGIELIAAERQEQLEKHGRTIDKDVRYNDDGQLVEAAFELLSFQPSSIPPLNWYEGIWDKMRSKPTKERLVIAGALIAAELDRLQAIAELNH